MRTLRVATSRWLFVTIIALGVGSCQSTVDTINVHLTELNSSTDDFRNQAILLNILRARQGAPLSFVNVTSIPTQYNANISSALPSFSVGPLQVQSGRPTIFSNTTLGTNFQNQTSPTFNNLVGKDFTQAATSGVSALQLLRLARDGFSIDLLFSLAVDKVTIKTSRGYVSFDTYPTRTVECPLIVDITPGGPMSGAQCLKFFRERGAYLGIDLQATDSQSRTKLTIAGNNEKSEKSTVEYNSSVDAVFCFNIPKNLDSDHLKRLGAIESQGMRCSPEKTKSAVNWLSADFRSLTGIYRFLGEYLRRPDVQDYYVDVSLNDNTESIYFREPLLTIIPDASGPCFVAVQYQGVRYCVPAQGAYRTKSVFAILDQIQNNNTDISKIPQPSVVTLTGNLR